MNIGWLIVSSLGGIVAFCVAVFVAIRAVNKQITATEENTVAVNKLSEKFDSLNVRVNGHDVKIAILEDRLIR